MGTLSGSSRMTARRELPHSCSCPAQPAGGNCRQSIYAAPSLRHVEVATGIQHVGVAAWQTCQQLQIVKLPPLVISLAEGAFQGCYVLREVAAPGCVFFPRVRTPCGHGAQVIVEGREEQTDGGERNEGPKTNPKPNTQARRPKLHHLVVFPLH